LVWFGLGVTVGGIYRFGFSFVRALAFSGHDERVVGLGEAVVGVLRSHVWRTSLVVSR